MIYSSYYQAWVNKKEMWFLVATLRSFEHLVFDRTLNKETGMVEFFVPHDLEIYFESLLVYYKNEGVIADFKKMDNRLNDPLALI